MSLLWFTATALILFATLQFWWIPALRRRVREDPTRLAVARAAKLVVLRYLRSVVLVAAMTALFAAVIVVILRIEGSPRLTVQSVREARHGFDGIKRRLGEARPLWFAGAATLVSVSLAVYLYRRRAFQLGAAFDAVRSAEIDRQIRLMQTDPNWWSLPPNPVMVEIANQIRQLQERLRTGPDYLRQSCTARINELNNLFIQVDVMRRIDVKLDPDAIEDPAPETWRESLGGVLGSPRVAGRIGLGSRLLHRANLALVVLGLIGLQSPAIRQAVDDRLVELSDLQVNFERLDGLNRRVQEISKSKDSALSTVVQQNFEHLSREAERIKAASREPRKAPDRPPSTPEESSRLAEELKVRRAEIGRREELLAAVPERTPEGPKHDGKKPPPETGPKPGPEPTTKPGPRPSELMTELDRAIADKADPARVLRDRIDKLHEALKAADPRAPVNDRLESLSRLESGLKQARDSALAEVDQISSGLDRVVGVRGREAEVAGLRARLSQARAELVATADKVSQELGTSRRDLESEVARKAADLSARRERVAAMADEAKSLARREAELSPRLEAARLRLAAAETRAEWVASAPTTPADARPAPLDEDATRAVNKIARAYEEALTETPIVRAAVAQPDPEAASRLRSMATSDAILSQAQARGATEHTRPPSMDSAPGLAPEQREIARDAQRVFRGDEPRTWAGDRMRQALAERARAEPGFRAKIVAKARSLGDGLRGALARFRGGPLLAGKPFWREIALSTLNLISPQLDLPGVAASAIDLVPREAFVHFEEVNRYTFLKEIGGDASVESAARSMADRDAKLPLGRTQEYVSKLGTRAQGVDATVQHLSPFEPAIEVPFDPGVDLAKAAEIVRSRAATLEERMRRVAGDALQRATPEELTRFRVRLTEEQSEAIINYADHFPSQDGLDAITPRARLVEVSQAGDSRLTPDDLADWSPRPPDPRPFDGGGPIGGGPIGGGPIGGGPTGGGPTGGGPTGGGGTGGNGTGGSGGGTGRGGEGGSRSPGGEPTPRTRPPGSGGSTRPTAEPRWATREMRPPIRTVRSSPSAAPVRAPSPRLTSSFASATRARSFIRLRGFARVGGVLIGREPEAGGGAKPDLVGLQWEFEGDRVRLIATTREGREVRSRPFPRETVALGLAYAADGRPTAATMVEARPLEELRILLHPALVDTALGRHVVQIDRFVDTYARTTPGGPYYASWRRETTGAVTTQFMLYRRAWALRLEVFADQIKKSGADPGSLPERAASQLQENGGESLDRLRLDLALKDRDALADKTRSVLVAKPEFFDPALVRVILDGAAGESLPAFDERVRRACREELDQARREASLLFGGGREERLRKLFRRWQTPAPTFTIWSGVRETPFSSTLEDVFPVEGREARRPVDFMLQVAFTSPPYFTDGEVPDLDAPGAEKELQSRYDKDPWQFPAVADKVREAVASALKEPANARDAETLEVVSEFIIAQRFFRAGLTGGLGKDFPVELLAELHDAVTRGPRPPASRTPRWNVRTGLLEAQLEAVVAGARDRLKKAAGDPGPWSRKLTTALDDLGRRFEEYRKRRDAYSGALPGPDATAGTDEDAVARRAQLRRKAWGEFQAWDRTWETEIARAVGALKALAAEIDRAGADGALVALLDEIDKPGADGDAKEADAKRCLSVLKGPPELVEICEGLVGALAMRRALNVAEDDLAQLLDEGNRRPRQIETAPARPARAVPGGATPPPASPPR